MFKYRFKMDFTNARLWGKYNINKSFKKRSSKLSIHFIIQLNLILKCGLNIIIPFSFTYDVSYCLSNYLYGIVRNSVYGFYDYNGYSILDGIEIIKPINKNIANTIDGSSFVYYCFGNVDKVYVKEGYQPLYNFVQYSLVVENFSIYWRLSSESYRMSKYFT